MYCCRAIDIKLQYIRKLVYIYVCVYVFMHLSDDNILTVHIRSAHAVFGLELWPLLVPIAFIHSLARFSSIKIECAGW